MKAKRPSLVEYAAEHPVHRGFNCWLCTIPERKEIEEAHQGGAAQSVIRHWLMEVCGYRPEDATVNRIGNHIRNHIPAKEKTK